MSGSRLTPEQDAYVAEHWDLGWQALAEELGVSRATVFSARRRARAASVPPPFEARPVVDRLWVTPANPETEALKSCADALDRLDPEACGRVLRYLTDRYSPQDPTSS